MNVSHIVHATWRPLLPVSSCAAMEQTSSSSSTIGRDIQTVHKTAKVTLVLLRLRRCEACIARRDHVLLTYLLTYLYVAKQLLFSMFSRPRWRREGYIGPNVIIPFHSPILPYCRSLKTKSGPRFATLPDSDGHNPIELNPVVHARKPPVYPTHAQSEPSRVFVDAYMPPTSRRLGDKSPG